jgi:hypothetical protein
MRTMGRRTARQLGRDLAGADQNTKATPAKSRQDKPSLIAQKFHATSGELRLDVTNVSPHVAVEKVGVRPDQGRPTWGIS